MANAAWGPRPATLIFVSQIPSCPVDFKVRFLGCVSRYDVTSGRLTLDHNYAVDGRHRPASVQVDVNLLLGAIDHTITRIGSWLTVVGYIREDDADRSNERNKVHVQALLVLAAGPVRIGEYERILCDMQQVERRLGR